MRVAYHHNLSDHHPLLLRGVCAGGVVGTRMENKDGVLWARLEPKKGIKEIFKEGDRRETGGTKGEREGEELITGGSKCHSLTF